MKFPHPISAVVEVTYADSVFGASPDTLRRWRVKFTVQTRNGRKWDLYSNESSDKQDAEYLAESLKEW